MGKTHCVQRYSLTASGVMPPLSWGIHIILPFYKTKNKNNYRAFTEDLTKEPATESISQIRIIHDSKKH